MLQCFSRFSNTRSNPSAEPDIHLYCFHTTPFLPCQTVNKISLLYFIWTFNFFPWRWWQHCKFSLLQHCLFVDSSARNFNGFGYCCHRWNSWLESSATHVPEINPWRTVQNSCWLCWSRWLFVETFLNSLIKKKAQKPCSSKWIENCCCDLFDEIVKHFHPLRSNPFICPEWSLPHFAIGKCNYHRQNRIDIQLSLTISPMSEHTFQDLPLFDLSNGVFNDHSHLTEMLVVDLLFFSEISSFWSCKWLVSLDLNCIFLVRKVNPPFLHIAKFFPMNRSLRYNSFQWDWSWALMRAGLKKIISPLSQVMDITFNECCFFFPLQSLV